MLQLYGAEVKITKKSIYTRLFGNFCLFLHI